MRASLCSAVFGIAIVGLVACDRDRRDEIGAEIAEIVPVAASAVVAKPPSGVSPEIWEDVRAFYSAEQRPVWVSNISTTGGADAVRLLATAREHGLDPADYREPELSATLASFAQSPPDGAQRIRRLAAFDIQLTTALLTLGRDVAVGRTRPKSIDRHWTAQRAVPDLVGTLRTASGDLDDWLDAMQPSHPQYSKLREALKTLVAPGDDATAAILAANMERWRWMPDDLGDNFLFVNIPSYELTAYEDDAPVLTMRVIVGKPELKTPVLSSTMNTVVFSPYWHIPASIATGETVPKAVEDPEYLRRGGFEILRVSKSGTRAVDPGEVDWSNPGELRQLTFRQRPGPQNALGYVKFLFPNPFNVYLHDTPGDRLFERTRRALSHGCVRLEDPANLAEYVLRHDARWDEGRIVTAMHSGTEQNVKLEDASALQVHIAYFTAWVTDTGQLNIYPDVYKYDRSNG